jgi:hypothetical protein
MGELTSTIVVTVMLTDEDVSGADGGTESGSVTLGLHMGQPKNTRGAEVTWGAARVTAQAVGLRLPTETARVRAQVKSCGICGG